MFCPLSADKKVRTELIMKTLKQIEHELILDWQNLQQIESKLAKSIALKAYYLKYAMYRKTRSWQQMLLEPAIF